MNGDLVDDMNGQMVVDDFIRTLLQIENPATRWISLSTWLPDLAEAAPDAFLNALNAFVEDAQAVEELFTEGGMFGGNPHTYVLWALERLAWSSDHFSHVVIALGALAAVDPGGQLANRPARSLRGIMLAWHPATGASSAQRLDALRLLFTKYETVAWQCAASLLPQPHDIGEPFQRPNWRGWAANIDVGVTCGDYWTFQKQLVHLMLEHVGVDGRRWMTLLEAAAQVNGSETNLGREIMDAVRQLDPEALTSQDAYFLGEGARALVMRHENFQTADWALKGETLAEFQRERDRLVPRRLCDRHRWLFSQWPEMPGQYDLSMEEQEEQLKSQRMHAVAAILANGGLADIIAWADEVEYPEALGHSLSDHGLDEADEMQFLRQAFTAAGGVGERPARARLGFGYAFVVARTADCAWRDTVAEMLLNEFGAEATAYFAQALPATPDTWQFLDKCSPEAASLYWSQVWINVLPLKSAEIAIPRFHSANRPYKAIDLVAMLIRAPQREEQLSQDDHRRITELARLVLDAEPGHLPSDEPAHGPSVGYSLEQILDYLEAQLEERAKLAGWEWKWLPLLDRHGGRGLKSLQGELAHDPHLFVELLKCIFRPSDEEPSESQRRDDPAARARAERAFHTLQSWVGVPGLDPDASFVPRDSLDDGLAPIRPAWVGNLDHASLTAWISQAVEVATEARQLEMCHQRIGRQLAYAPADPCGTWPCESVCRVVERLANDDIDSGLELGVINRRGVYTVTHDGNQESQIARQFRKWCETVRGNYPRTGAILRSLAEYYEGEAKREIRKGKLLEYDM